MERDLSSRGRRGKSPFKKGFDPAQQKYASLRLVGGPGGGSWAPCVQNHWGDQGVTLLLGRGPELPTDPHREPAARHGQESTPQGNWVWLVLGNEQSTLQTPRTH